MLVGEEQSLKQNCSLHQ